MSRHINELAEIVLGHVYQLGYQHRSDIGKHHETADELVAVQRKLRETEQELQRLRRVHMESQSEELTEARATIADLRRAERELTQAYSDACEKVNRLVCAEQDLLAEIDFLRKQLANAQQELPEQGLVHGVELQRETADLRQQLDAAQAALTRERLDAEERNELNCRQQKGGE
jgi:hypothetical protein